MWGQEGRTQALCTLRIAYASAVPAVPQQAQGLGHNTPQKLMGQPPGVHCPAETREAFLLQRGKGEQTPSYVQWHTHMHMYAYFET